MGQHNPACRDRISPPVCLSFLSSDREADREASREASGGRGRAGTAKAQGQEAIFEEGCPRDGGAAEAGGSFTAGMDFLCLRNFIVRSSLIRQYLLVLQSICI